jgi:anti-sigma factor (TIGR02949 family)
MKCTQRDEELQAFFDGELDPSRAASLREHVAACPYCQSRLQLFQNLRSELRAHAAAYKAPANVRDQIGNRLRQLERRRRRSWNAAAAIAAIAVLSSLGGVYWLNTGPRASSLLQELASAHAGVVRGEITLTYPSADVDMVRRWLGQRLSFRPAIPRATWGGFHLLGARTLSLSNQPGALLLFGKDDSKVSLVSLSNPGQIPSSGKPVDMDGIRFWIFIQGIYTIVLWSEDGLLYAMVSDEEADETLEYAHLCAQQMRAPA